MFLYSFNFRNSFVVYLCLETENDPVVVGSIKIPRQLITDSGEQTHKGGQHRTCLVLTSRQTKLSLLLNVMKCAFDDVVEYKVCGEVSDQVITIMISGPSRLTLERALFSLARIVPSDVALFCDFLDDDVAEKARQSMLNELKICLNSSNSTNPSLVLAAQVETDEAICSMMERKCEDCTKI